jgi:hypothetical protein
MTWGIVGKPSGARAVLAPRGIPWWRLLTIVVEHA